MNKTIFFSIVIPLYNKENSIKNTLQSVLEQTFKKFEVIVVNDGSTDNSLKIVQSFDDERIRIINKKNGGVSSARNLGIKEARFNWISFLDGDDIWEPVFLEKMYEFIIYFPKAGLYGCAYAKINSHKKNFIDFNLPENFCGIVENYFEKAQKNTLFWTSAVIVSRAILKKVGGFDEKITIGEDIDLWIRVALDYEVAFNNEILAYYNLDGPNRAMDKKLNFKQSIHNYLVKYKKWEGKNEKFSEFINLWKLKKVAEILRCYEVSKDEFQKYIISINRKKIPLKYRFFLILPFAIKIIIVKVRSNKVRKTQKI